MEIFVVDNNSTDGSREYLENKFSAVQFRWQEQNLGFAKANNSVLNETKGDYILFLNPDCIVPEDCFIKCLQFFNKESRCAALGVRMIDGSGQYLKESKRSYPSPRASFFKLTGLAALFPSSEYFAAYYSGHLSQRENHVVDVLAGAYIMLKNSVLKKVKGFDEDFFMYGEDIDLSYRIQKAGFMNFYFSGTSILHFKGESTVKLSGKHIKRFYAAMLLFVKKHYRKKSFIFLLMLCSIFFSKLLAYVLLSIKKTVGLFKNQETRKNTAIVASISQFDQVIHLLRHATKPLTITGRIAEDENDVENSIGSLKDLNLLFKNGIVEQVVFCEGNLQFSEIIRLMDETVSGPDFLLHAMGSSSIVGSASKNSQGTVIAAT